MNTAHKNYTFTPGASGVGTVTLLGLDVPIDRISLITNASRGVIIYSPIESSRRAAAYTQTTNSVLTLHLDTSSHTSNDKLIILVDDGKVVPTMMLSDDVRDAFGRIQTGDPGYRFDSQHTYQIESDLWDTSTSGSAVITHNSTDRCAVLTTSGANSFAILQSHYPAPYTPGRGQCAMVTVVPGVTAANVVKRSGLFDGENGVCFEVSDNISFRVLTTTTPGGDSVAQSSWNIDKFDGSGPSGIVLDITKSQIIYFQIQALYAGAVVCGFDVDGRKYPAHMFKHANLLSAPYIANANLPIRCDITQTSGTTVNTLKPICSTVFSEGGTPLIEMPTRNSAYISPTGISITSRRPVISIRVNSTINNIKNNSVVIPKSVEGFSQSASTLWEVVLNGTLTNASFNTADANGISVDNSADAISGGVVLDSFISSGDTWAGTTQERGIGGKIVLAYSHLLARGDVLTLVATGVTGTPIVRGTIKVGCVR